MMKTGECKWRSEKAKQDSVLCRMKVHFQSSLALSLNEAHFLLAQSTLDKNEYQTRLHNLTHIPIFFLLKLYDLGSGTTAKRTVLSYDHPKKNKQNQMDDVQLKREALAT